jgi:hypothetical protein
VEALGGGNIPHRSLRDRAEAYRAIIDQSLETIDFAIAYVQGVRLENARRAAVADRELPPLDHPVQEVRDSLLQLNGTFMLATAEGIEIIAAEERYRRTQEEVEYRAAEAGLRATKRRGPSRSSWSQLCCRCKFPDRANCRWGLLAFMKLWSHL